MEIASVAQPAGEVVRLQFGQALKAMPASFSVQNPARVVLDFEGLELIDTQPLAMEPRRIVRAARVVQSGGRTRVVLSLAEAAPHRLQLDGNSLLVLFDASSKPDTHATATPTFSGKDGLRDPPQPLRDLDFRRGSDGAGRLIVELPSAEVAVDVRQQGALLLVEVLGAQVPQRLRRRLDVQDFATPVHAITTLQQGDNARIQVEPKGDWEHVAYQSGRQLVVEVREKREELLGDMGRRNFNGERISLNFQNVDVRSLLQVIADFSNFNLVMSDSVSGAVTLRLKDVPWDQALDVVLRARNLGMDRQGSVMHVAPKDELAARLMADRDALAAAQTAEPLVTEAFQLNWTKATEVAAQITALGGGLASGSGSANAIKTGGLAVLSARGSISPEPRTNQIFVSDVPSSVRRVGQLLRRIDVPTKQVMIEARIVEASDTFGKSVGVKLGGLVSGSNARLGSNYGQVTGSTLTNNSSNTFVNLPASGEGGFGASSYAISLFNTAGTRALNLEISALEADGKGKVLASPRVVTADQATASIEQGTELPYQVATASGATSIAFRKANLKLEVTPQITPDGGVILDLTVNKDSVGQETAAGLAINTKQIKTKVLVENGGTIMMGGIYEVTENKDESRVPLLGELPVLGALFRNRSSSVNKQEILIFITPRVLADQAVLR